jgi:hypothetical protein
LTRFGTLDRSSHLLTDRRFHAPNAEGQATAAAPFTVFAAPGGAATKAGFFSTLSIRTLRCRPFSRASSTSSPSSAPRIALPSGDPIASRPFAVALGRAVGCLAGHRQCTADRVAGCTGVHPALAGLRASATAITGMASARRRHGTGFGRCATWRGRSRNSRARSGANLRSGRPAPTPRKRGETVSRPSSGYRCALFPLAEHPKNRTDTHVKIGGDPTQPQAFGAGPPNCGYLRGIGFLKALPSKRPPL